MTERISDFENLEERLKEYPELQAKIETMLSLMENARGDLEKAAAAERLIIEELQRMIDEVVARRQQQTRKNNST